jgi:hypothetical protein
MTAHAEQEELRVRLEQRSAAEAEMALRLETAELRAAAAAEAKARAAATVRSGAAFCDVCFALGSALPQELCHVRRLLDPSSTMKGLRIACVAK